jgi:protein-S-isoprenylcysteine O-methyltransferase Ste14
MKPYFATSHLAGVLLLIVTMGWGAMELAKASSTREGATRIGGGGRRFAMLPTMITATAMLYLGPHFVPAAAIRPGAAAFAAGMVVLVAGLVLRGWSIMTLGDYFTGRVMVSADQPVITAGPYRMLRHPSYTGFLLACLGVGLASANWVALAAMVVLPLAVFFWRIHAEETALLATLGDRYRAYAAQHKRLVPFVW